MSLRPYVFYRFSIEDEGSPLTHEEILPFLESARGVWVSHRVPRDREGAKDTALIQLRTTLIEFINEDDSEDVIYFNIVRELTTRLRKEYNDKLDVLEEVVEEGKDMMLGMVVCLPGRGLMAVEDSSGKEALGAQSTVARLRSVVRVFEGHRFMSALAASSNEVRSAIARWEVDNVSFRVWPYNPHPKKAGEHLAALLAPGKVEVSGSIKPYKNGQIDLQQGGFVNEVVELGTTKHAEYGVTGKTSDGYRARIQKAAPEDGSPVKLKVYIPVTESTESHIKAAAKAMLEIYVAKPSVEISEDE
ncbi:MAG: hypothetical protein KQJ78_11125 [Deltaproteobacteria bacterium]|nr:hypothetical protein [Deltaproteobacteria bacterium]